MSDTDLWLQVERPPRERIQEILDKLRYDTRDRRMRYETRRDYLQLCAEVDHLRVIERRYKLLVENKWQVSHPYARYLTTDEPTFKVLNWEEEIIAEGPTPEAAIDAAGERLKESE